MLPEAVFGQGCAAFAVDDRILTEPGWDGDLVRVTGHCGATLVVLSDDARVMERSVGGLPLPLDGGRVVLAPAGAAGMRAALATALRSGEPGSGIAVAAPAHLLLAEPMAAAEWWPAVRSGTVRMVSLGAEEGADRQFLARLWQAGVAAGTSRWRSWRRCCAGSRRGCYGCPGRGASIRAVTPTWRCSTRRPRRPTAERRDHCVVRMPTRSVWSAALWSGCCVAGRMPLIARGAGSALRPCASRCDNSVVSTLGREAQLALQTVSEPNTLAATGIVAIVATGNGT